MKLSRDEFRDLTRGFLTDIQSPKNDVIKEQAAPQRRTESGNPQSYKDFAERLDAITRLAEDLSMDYVDSDWLSDGDHASLANDVDLLFVAADDLMRAAMGLAQSKREI